MAWQFFDRWVCGEGALQSGEEVGSWERFVADVARNTLRYIKLFSEAVDEVLHELRPDSFDDCDPEDVIDVIRWHRETTVTPTGPLLIFLSSLLTSSLCFITQGVVRVPRTGLTMDLGQNGPSAADDHSQPAAPQLPKALTRR